MTGLKASAATSTPLASGGLLYLSSADVARACRDVDAVGCVEAVLRQHATGKARVADEAVLRWSPQAGQFARTLNMPGMVDADPVVVGTKIINANTGNPDRGLARADGLTLLFDPVTAWPYAVLHAAHISALRTAAVSTLAARALRSATATTLGVIGAGAIARAHVKLMTGYLPLHRVLLSDLLPDRAVALAAQLRDSIGSDIEITATDPQKAIRQAGILVTATTTTTPYIAYEWLASGSVAVNVSLDDFARDVYERADRLYVDDWQLIVTDTQRLLGRLAREGAVAGPGELTPASGRAVTGTLGQLLTGGCPGRNRDSDVVLVNPFGMAIEDLALAHLVVQAAQRLSLGIRLPR